MRNYPHIRLLVPGTNIFPYTDVFLYTIKKKCVKLYTSCFALLQSSFLPPPAMFRGHSTQTPTLD
jgi:hypothetical protein